MTDFNPPAASATLPQNSPLPAVVPASGAALAGVAALAALASLTLLFLLPRVGGRISSWRRSIAGLRLLAPTRER